MYYVIIGIGPNGIAIPALIFSSRDKAEKFLEDHKIPDLATQKPGDYDNPEQYEPYYIGYYGGCGECSSFKIEEVEEGIPFVGWDLD